MNALAFEGRGAIPYANASDWAGAAWSPRCPSRAAASVVFVRLAELEQTRDVVGPDDAIGEWHLSEDAESVLADVARTAELTDSQGIERSLIDSLARVGLLGAPQSTPAQQREVIERLAMADASVWFSWAQHQSPMNLLAKASQTPATPFADEIKDRWLEGLQSGKFLASVAFAHLRRPGEPNPIAHRVARGWEVTGKLDWVTSWDIADVMLLMVRGSGDYADKVVCFYLPAGREPVFLDGMHVREPLQLLAMSGTHTRPMTFESVTIPDSNVAAVLDFEEWAAADGLRSIDVNPATFGLIRGALTELKEVGEKRNDRQVLELVDSMVLRARELRRAAYQALDSGADLDLRAELRAKATEFMLQAVTAVIAARAGAAMQSGCSAERRVREAMFMHVRAQTPLTRAATFDMIDDVTSSLASSSF